MIGFQPNPSPTLTYKPRASKATKGPEGEPESLARDLAGYAQTGLAAGLHVLDTPGSIVRGGIGHLVGARPAEGERTSGRDLTNAIGLTSKHSNSWLSGGIGLAVDVATDPLTYLTAGTHHALTGAGKAIAKTGGIRGLSRKAMIQGFHGVESSHLGDAIKLGMTPAEAAADLAHARNQGARIATPAQEQAVQAALGRPLKPNEPLGALAGFGLPFKAPSILIGTGPKAKAVAGHLDTLGDKLKYGNPISRGLNALFDPTVNEATGAASQRAFAQYGRPALDATKDANRDDYYRTVAGINEAIGKGFPESDVLKAARQVAEGVRLRGASPQVATAAQPIGDLVRRSGDSRLAEATRLGLPLEDLADKYVAHAPRAGVDLASARQVAAGKAPARIGVQLGPGSGPLPLTSSASRSGVYRDIPGGSEMINDWAARHAGDPLGLGVRGIRRGVFRDMAGEILATGSPLTRDTIKALGSKADVVAKRLAKLSPDHSTHGIGLFSSDLAEDLSRVGDSHARNLASAKATYGLIGDHARPATSLPSDSVPVSEVLKRIGLKTRPFDAATGKPIEGALVQAHQALARQGAGPVDGFLMGKNGKLRRAVDQFALPRSVADELFASHAKWSTPEAVKGPLGLFDSTTSLFKSLAYPLWPASNVRNAIGAGVNNLTMGTGLADHVAQLKLMRNTLTAEEARKILPSMPAEISDDAARDWLRREQFSTGGIFAGSTGSLDLDNVSAKLQSQVPGQTTPIVPGSDRTAGGSFARDTAGLIGGGIKDQAGAFANKIRHPRSAPSPIEVAGAFGGLQDFPALKTGRKVGENIEDLFRGAHWLGQRRAGFDAATAGKATKDLHFAYDDVTRFEKNVMRRLFPFYTFGSKNLPMQARRLASTPGSTAAQLRLMSAGNDPSNPLPNSLASGLTIPTGQGSDGKGRYLSGFGLPIEDAMSRIPFKGGLPDPHGTATSYASGLNPIIKFPLEQLTGTDLFTGRKLSDLKPSATASALGRLIGDDNPRLLSRVLANTPATRFVSTLDRLLDDRNGAWVKALALASGLKLSDIDVEAARRGDEAKARSELMAGSPRLRPFTNYSIRPGEEANLTPDELALLRSEVYARQAAQARAKRIGIQPKRPDQ